MQDYVINTRIINRHDTKENWDKNPNFTPRTGEIVIYDDDKNSRIKIGDGKTEICNLPFSGMNVDLYGDSIELEQEFYVNANTLGGVHAEDYALKSGTVTLNDTDVDFEEELVYTNANTLGGVHASDYALKAKTVSLNETDEEIVEGTFFANANLLGGIHAEDYALKTKTVAQEFSQQTETSFVPTTINSIQGAIVELQYDEESDCHFTLLPENVQQIVSLNVPNYSILTTNHIVQDRVLVVKFLFINYETLTLQKYQHAINAVVYYY